MPKVSICMPTYNQQKFIYQAVDSILAQTFQDWELIIVNDGSTDDTFKTIAHYSRDPRIHIIGKENGGTGSALNYGFQFASGIYETWFASDNVMYPDMLKELVDVLDAHECIDYVYANCEIGVMDHTGLAEEQRKNLKQEVDQTWKPDVLLKHYFLGISWLWRKNLRIKSGPWQQEPCEDYDQVLRMLDAGGKFAFHDKCLAWFRRHGENMSMKVARSGDRDQYSRLVQEKCRQRRGMK